jgi:hypothetical protein
MDDMPGGVVLTDVKTRTSSGRWAILILEMLDAGPIADVSEVLAAAAGLLGSVRQSTGGHQTSGGLQAAG